MPCQSGRSAAGLASALAIAAAPAALASPTGWAHQAASFQSNGAVTVKSLAGGSYAGTQNPTGAMAKTNQNAATQAPTVIIQATAAGGYAEAIPLLVTGTTVFPNCPAGYNRIFSANSATFGFTPSIFNAGGSRFSLTGFNVPSSGWTFYGWLIDSVPTTGPQNVGAGAVYAANNYWYNGSPPSGWAAAVCTK